MCSNLFDYNSRCCRTKPKDEKACKARITTTLKANGLYRINVTQPLHNHEQTNRIIKKLRTSDGKDEDDKYLMS